MLLLAPKTVVLAEHQLRNICTSRDASALGHHNWKSTIQRRPVRRPPDRDAYSITGTITLLQVCVALISALNSQVWISDSRVLTFATRHPRLIKFEKKIIPRQPVWPVSGDAFRTALTARAQFGESRLVSQHLAHSSATLRLEIRQIGRIRANLPLS